MTKLYLKYFNDRRAAKRRFQDLAGLDRHALEDIGVQLNEFADVIPRASNRGSAVIASGLSARWSLSGDWDTDRY